MSSNTPSGRRKAGREAFHPNVDPMDIMPYHKTSCLYNMDVDDWLDGWREAEAEYKDKQKENKINDTYCPNCRSELTCLGESDIYRCNSCNREWQIEEI